VFRDRIDRVGNVKEREKSMKKRSPILTTKGVGKNLVLGLIAMFSVAVVGLSGTTYATGGGDEPTNGAPTSKEDCKHGGWKKYGFKNQGQCIKWVNAHGYGGPGNGGGHSGDVSTWLDLDITGDDNVVNIVINYFFG